MSSFGGRPLCANRSVGELIGCYELLCQSHQGLLDEQNVFHVELHWPLNTTDCAVLFNFYTLLLLCSILLHTIRVRFLHIKGVESMKKNSVLLFLFLGVHRQVLLATIGWFIGYHVTKYENYVYAKRDRDMKEYIRLHPEELAPKGTWIFHIFGLAGNRSLWQDIIKPR